MKKIILVLSIFTLPVLFLGHVKADGFIQNRIIDDAVFNNVGTMNAQQIDAFLNQFSGSCISVKNGFTTPDPTGYSPSTGYTFGSNVSAGQAIYDASQAYGLNPQVLIATLQKEQALATGGAGCYSNTPNPSNSFSCDLYGNGATYNCTSACPHSGGCINIAFGLGCPYNCDANTEGFSPQLIRAAWRLRFNEQRSEGNINWAVIKGNWNNSDDPQSCYWGRMTQGTWQTCPNGSSTYYDGWYTIDNTSIHMDNGATASLYNWTPHLSGNQSFYSIFTGWFGNTLVPTAFVTPTNGTVYVQTNGYKFSVPSMAVLQDFGISPSSIQTISQSSADTIPVPDSSTGYSTNIDSLVKSPASATVYLISAGKRYAIQSMQQFNDFGYNTTNIVTLPQGYIYSITDGGALNNFISTPSSNVFKVTSGSKSIVFDQATFNSLDPSGTTSFLSDYAAHITPSSTPTANREILVQNQSGTIYLFDNGVFYTLPSMDVFNCWGFTGPLGTPLYRLANDSYMSPVTNSSILGCSLNTDQTTTYVLNGASKIPVPASYGFSSTIPNQDLLTLANKIPVRSLPLGQTIKSDSGSTVWYIESGVRKAIPSMTDLSLLHISTSQIDIIGSGAAFSIPVKGVKIGIGQVVMSNTGGAVYVVTGSASKTSFANGDDFTAYGYSWQGIETFSSTVLDQLYPTSTGNISKYLYVQSSNNTYLMDSNGCYLFSDSQLSSYGQSQANIQNNQTYNASIFPYTNLPSCKQISAYTKSPSSSTVYQVNNGQKDPVSSWARLQSISQQSNPYIITLGDSTLATLPTGPSI